MGQSEYKNRESVDMKKTAAVAYAAHEAGVRTEEKDISSGNLSTKYKNVTQTTAKNVRGVLMKIVELIVIKLQYS
ncbi:hypothetical protein [Pedobacter psychroterrae]|uniref:Uncharacterized protein n=1 Tax=Pedobacter psychroterrae TaxID=2530453 RepID=A0A4R0NPU8_9SPHI|nr:hypothetical protein [Pedobacter psychroterrae]TCD01265.1 hypothetical protein EZ437_10950 [Pedobacter psychroterrae]